MFTICSKLRSSQGRVKGGSEGMLIQADFRGKDQSGGRDNCFDATGDARQ